MGGAGGGLIGKQHPAAAAASVLAGGVCKLLEQSPWPALRMCDTNQRAKSMLLSGRVQCSAVLYYGAAAVLKVLNADEMLTVRRDHAFTATTTATASARSPLNQ